MKKIIAVLLSVLMLCTVFCGCENLFASEESKEPSALAIVAGPHKYFYKIPLNTESVYTPIYDVCQSYGNVSIIVVDGSPYIGGKYNIDAPEKNLSSTKKKQLAKQNARQIIAESSALVTKTPEIDTLSAIRLAGNSLKSTNLVNKSMLIFDSGLSTTGLLDFVTMDLFSCTVDDIVKELEDFKALPDLQGVTVSWMGCGEVTGEQEKLPESYKYKLKELWSAIIVAGGGSVQYLSDAIPSEEINTDTIPYCSLVKITQDKLDLSKINKLDESTVKFKGDEDKFEDIDVATKALSPYAKALKEQPDVNITIAGTTASVGTDEWCNTLSLKRALACKSLLVTMGANADQINCVGLGKRNWDYRVDDIDSSGNLIENEGKKNRAVFIFDSNSEIAKLIKGV